MDFQKFQKQIRWTEYTGYKIFTSSKVCKLQEKVKKEKATFIDTYYK